jgi:DNA polymerase-3 subunit delta'
MPWNLLGLEGVKAALSDMLLAGRVPHALLLTGPAGAGKFSLSMALGQALNCLSPAPDMSPCLECASCRKTAGLTHPDFMVVEPKGARGTILIDDIRALRSALNYRPFEGRLKVAVVRGADTFKEDSGGALLKTLEEPTPNTVIILNALSEAAVMATLVSRCVRLRVPPLPRAVVLEALTRAGQSPDRAALLAGLSGGALGAALSLDGDMAEKAWRDLDGVLGLKGRPEALAGALDWTADLSAVLEKLKKKEDSRPEARRLQNLTLDCLRLWLRDVAALAATGEPARLLGPPASSAQWAWAKSVTAEAALAFHRSLERLADGLARSLRLEIIFENFWLDVLE